MTTVFMLRNQKLVRKLEELIFTVHMMYIFTHTLASNRLSILPILSPETRAMKEALRGVGFQETHPTSHLFSRFNFFTTCTQCTTAHHGSLASNRKMEGGIDNKSVQYIP
jgi:hypothetical protein